jgi:ATP-dependent helicase/nuclease subunit A
LPSLRKEERVGRIAEEQARVELAEQQEHWRLLYVAMTRAEEALFIGGALGSREREPAEGSWYAQVRGLFGADDWQEDALWSARLEWGAAAAPVASGGGPAERAQPAPLPGWLDAAPAAEPRPARPLAPSALGEDVSPDPPWPPQAGALAARRGVLVHKLLERLPDLPEDARHAAGERWLARNAAAFDAVERAALLDAALAAIVHPGWAELFSPAGLAEVPIAALVGGHVIAGTIDRLLVEPERVRIVDFKTARRPPETVEQVPVAIQRQMAAYVCALEAAYPGRRVEAALLYTAVPRLLALPDALLAAHKQALRGGE